MVFYRHHNGWNSFILEECLSREYVQKVFELTSDSSTASRFQQALPSESSIQERFKADWHALRQLSCYLIDPEYFEKVNVELIREGGDEKNIVNQLCGESPALKFGLESIDPSGNVNFAMFDSLRTVFSPELTIDKP